MPRVVAVIILLMCGFPPAVAAPTLLKVEAADLDVLHKGKHHLQATFKTGEHHIHADITNNSLSIVNNALPEFVISAKGELVGGYRIVIRQIMDKSFISMRSSHGRIFTLPTSADGTHYHPTSLKAMFDEATVLHERAMLADMAYDAALSGLFKEHKSSLKAFADMVWRLNSEHNINGVEHPHTLRLHILAKETAQALQYQPTSAPNPKRVATHHQRALFSNIGSMFSPSPPRTGALGGSCADNTCSSSGQCSGSSCRGMCGPSCYCWKGICNTCCWMQFCESHDDCCTRVGMTGSACYSVLQDYMSKQGISCYSHYSCSSFKSFAGHRRQLLPDAKADDATPTTHR